MRIDAESGALLPEAHLYALDLDADHWPVHQYWLMCRDVGQFTGVKALPNGITVEELNPTAGFAKQMYWDVGGPWIWGDKRAYSDAQWLDYTALPGFRQFKLCLKDGTLAGFAETSFDIESGQAELEYFGLLPQAVGLKAGSAFLSQIIGKLWDGRCSRIRLSTCTLDHPGAFRVYSRCGFERLSSHSTSVPNAVKARIISSQEIQIRTNLLR
jgi:GNAT superfamily N-acetyltransferase